MFGQAVSQHTPTLSFQKRLGLVVLPHIHVDLEEHWNPWKPRFRSGAAGFVVSVCILQAFRVCLESMAPAPG